MLTQREFELYCSVLRHPCLSYVLPYDFSRFSSSNTIQVFLPTNSGLKKGSVVFQLYLCALYAVFGGVRMAYITMIFLNNNMESNVAMNLPDLLLGYFFLLVRISHLLLPLTLSYSGYEFAQFVNRQNELVSKMGHVFLGKPYLEPNKIRELLLQGFTLCCRGFLPVTLTVIAINMNKDWFMYSLLPMNWQVSITFCVFVGIEAGILFLLVEGLLCLVLVVYVYLTSTNFWIAQLSTVTHSYEPTETRILKIQTILKYYQCLQLQNGLFNEIFCNTFIRGFLCILVVGITGVAFCAVRLSKSLDVTTYSMFPCMAVLGMILLMIPMGIMGQVHDNSWELITFGYKKLLNSSGQPYSQIDMKTKSLISRRILQTPPLKVWIGNLYFMKMKTTLTIIALLVNSTVNFLVTF